MRRRRRKAPLARRLLHLGVALIGLLTVEEAGWAALAAISPEGRSRVALATAVIRDEMARVDARVVGIKGLSWAEAVSLRRRLGLSSVLGAGPGYLNVRFGTVQCIGVGRYTVDALIDARWAKGHRLQTSRIELRVRDGKAVVTARHPLRNVESDFSPGNRRARMTSSRSRQYP